MDSSVILLLAINLYKDVLSSSLRLIEPLGSNLRPMVGQAVSPNGPGFGRKGERRAASVR